jgi:RNA polymerase sigma-70 factor, ECF subfamily
VLVTTARRDPAPADAAFQRIAEAHSRDVLAYFARRVEPVADAADLLADVLLVAWRRRDIIPVEATEARMWLFGIARRTLANHRRGRIRHDALAERLRGETVLQVESEDHELRRYEAELLLESVGPLDREILTLVYWDGFRLDEVARILGRNASTVRARHARALARLRRAAGTGNRECPV